MQSSSGGTVKRACPLSFLSAALPTARRNYSRIVSASFVHVDLYPIYPIMRGPRSYYTFSRGRFRAYTRAFYQIWPRPFSEAAYFNNNNRTAAQGLQRVLILFHIYSQLLYIISFLRGFITFIDRPYL